jgi:hypothetical protein
MNLVNLFCIEEFKDEFEKLKKKKNYKTLEAEIIEYFFDKKTEDIRSGANLNHDLKTPFIKKKLEGSGGYRVYYLLVIHKNDAFLMYIYPKTGPLGISDTSLNFKKELLKKVYDCILKKDYYRVLKDDNKNITFEKFKEEKEKSLLKEG